ncbi:hypothetical protein TPHA_0C00820 [Tetrapisispora phaffii CBS 4417]|uniref:Defective in cullin neddylation protein n=1 Tax=Tetrapisispora phaffii (strain ATCC 24235 / CBS 4417 / NBRC 1672 / NRRL Y-8282 / UCD 70-5) TaxID=1071381 RepID=G8BR62_TETPH|nr:hypothetical protein TPHA_0C00820 [Tetrapisispora phaffii CBS 4417]CCE62238.1 hypothetical protein TPHA_0C00820 [Tetrapisispora phaffii CBS 4417]
MDSIVREFQQLTSSSNKVARKYLSGNDWNLNYALNEFYDQELGGFVHDVPREYPAELIELFERYNNQKYVDGSSGNEEDVGIDADGLIQFIEDLGYELEDLTTLCLANVMGCNNLTDCITRNQFLEAWYNKKCSNIKDIKDELETVGENLRSDINYFTYIYNYSFGLITEENMKSIQIDTAKEYWKLFFGDGTPLHIEKEQLDNWNKFLTISGKKTITKDEWKMILEFFKKFPTVTEFKDEYDPMDPWPYIMDEYHEYLEENGKLN